jgi:hypothetical protein
METETEDENPGFVIEQDQSQNECPYCFCKPCITNEQNSQLWWHANTEEPHLRNSGLRKEHYKFNSIVTLFFSDSAIYQ